MLITIPNPLFDIKQDELEAHIAGGGTLDDLPKLLKRWTEKQRHQYNQKELSPERVSRLDSIDFIWDMTAFNSNKHWDMRFVSSFILCFCKTC